MKILQRFYQLINKTLRKAITIKVEKKEKEIFYTPFNLFKVCNKLSGRKD